jgi:hypothetical protein
MGPRLPRRASWTIIVLTWIQGPVETTLAVMKAIGFDMTVKRHAA